MDPSAGERGAPHRQRYPSSIRRIKSELFRTPVPGRKIAHERRRRTLPAKTARPNTIVSVEKMPTNILRKLDIALRPSVNFAK
jgi:hypothetical protein